MGTANEFEKQMDGALAFRTATDGTYNYYGEASPGADTSKPVWRISRLTISSTAIMWADGSGGFDNVWDDHLTLTYS